MRTTLRKFNSLNQAFRQVLGVGLHVVTLETSKTGRGPRRSCAMRSIAGVCEELQLHLPRYPEFKGQPWLITIGCPSPCSV